MKHSAKWPGHQVKRILFNVYMQVLLRVAFLQKFVSICSFFLVLQLYESWTAMKTNKNERGTD